MDYIKTVKSLYPDARRVLFVTWFEPIRPILVYSCTCGERSAMTEKQGVYANYCEVCGVVSWTHSDFIDSTSSPSNKHRIPGRWVGNKGQSIQCNCGYYVELQQDNTNRLWSGVCFKCKETLWNYNCVWGYDEMQTPGPLTQELFKKALSLDTNIWVKVTTVKYRPFEIKVICCRPPINILPTPGLVSYHDIQKGYITLDAPCKHYGSVVYYATQCEKCSKGWWACSEPQKLENLLAINLELT